MARKKIITEAAPEQIQESVALPESEAKANFRALIKAYKIQNPVKYAQKREALEKKLNSMQ